MRVVEKPSINQKEILEACVSNIQDHDLRVRVQNELDYFNSISEEYDFKGHLGELSQIPIQDKINENITKEEMLFLYRKLSAKGQPARKFYDFLLHASKICPFCGYRTSGTLDHYLPKSYFPEFAVNPFNLIPCCRDCNSKKLSDIPNRESETLHPYYDKVDQDKWLYAEIDCEKEIGFRFFVKKPENWSERKFKKLDYHFKAFELSDLYSIFASQELNDHAYLLKKFYNEGGSSALEEILKEFKESAENHYVNSWKSAMYEALAKSNWFCTTGISNFPI